MRITYLTVFVVTLLTGWVCFVFFGDFNHYVTATTGKATGQIIKHYATVQEVCTRALVWAAVLATLNTFTLWRWQKLRSLRYRTLPTVPEQKGEHAA